MDNADKKTTIVFLFGTVLLILGFITVSKSLGDTIALSIFGAIGTGRLELVIGFILVLAIFIPKILKDVRRTS